MTRYSEAILTAISKHGPIRVALVVRALDQGLDPFKLPITNLTTDVLRDVCEALALRDAPPVSSPPPAP
jgi:hypothetical protein